MNVRYEERSRLDGVVGAGRSITAVPISFLLLGMALEGDLLLQSGEMLLSYSGRGSGTTAFIGDTRTRPRCFLAEDVKVPSLAYSLSYEEGMGCRGIRSTRLKQPVRIVSMASKLQGQRRASHDAVGRALVEPTTMAVYTPSGWLDWKPAS